MISTVQAKKTTGVDITRGGYHVLIALPKVLAVLGHTLVIVLLFQRPA